MQNACITNLLKNNSQKVNLSGSMTENWKKNLISRKQNFYCSKCPNRDKKYSFATPA